MKDNEALMIVGVLAAAYPNVVGKMSAMQAAAWADVYAAGIIDLDHGQCRAAVDRLIKSSQWLSIAEIRAAVISVTRGQRRTGAEAWQDVVSTIGLPPSSEMPHVFHGKRGNDEPAFVDPITVRCVRGLGWREIRLSENQPADRARFIEAYDEMAGQGRIEAQVSAGAAAPALPSRSGSTTALGAARPQPYLMEPEPKLQLAGPREPVPPPPELDEQIAPADAKLAPVEGSPPRRAKKGGR